MRDNVTGSIVCNAMDSIDSQRATRILIIDDSPDTRQHYVRLFSRAQFDVRTMQNCQQAEEFLNDPNLRLEDTPDVIITDNVMLTGSIGGLTFARRFRKKYPILIFSYDEQALKSMREEGFITVDKIEEDDVIFSKVNRAIHEHGLYKTTMHNEENIVILSAAVSNLGKMVEENKRTINDNHVELKEILLSNGMTKECKPKTKEKIVEFIKSPNFKTLGEIMVAFFSLMKWVVIIVSILGIVVLGSNPKFQDMILKTLPIITNVSKSK